MSVSAAVAGGFSLAGLSRAKDLKKRLWFTAGTLLVFRLLSFIPLPGIDPLALSSLFNRTHGGVLDFINMFSGGSLERMSLIALGLMPYITASIVIQVATAVSPALMALKKDGESGRKKLNQYTRYGTVFLCAVQGYFIAVGLESWGANEGHAAVTDPGLLFRITTAVSLVGGSMFLMWLGEQITQRGVGNGVSLIITAGIVAQLPPALGNALESGRSGSLSPFTLFIVVAFAAGLTLAICFIELAQRKVSIQYPKHRAVRGAEAERSHLPLKINMANVIPPIFASSLLLMPLTIVQFAGTNGSGDSAWGDFVITLTTALQHGSPIYMTLYAAGIAFFCFFYTGVVFDSQETADNLKRHGGFIPGIRPGKATAGRLDYVLTRLTVVGAFYLVVICLLPEIVIAKLGVPFFLGGTSLLIVVNVCTDTLTQVQGHLLAHQYGSLTRGASFRRTH